MGNMSVWGMILKGASDHVTGYMMHRSGRDAKRVALRNKEFADRAAADALLRGEMEVSRHRLEIGQITGAQRAALASSGVDVGEGTAVNIFEDTAAMGELDILTIRNNAEREAWGYEIVGLNALWQGEIAEWQGYLKKSAHMLGSASEGMTMGGMMAGTS